LGTQISTLFRWKIWKNSNFTATNKFVWNFFFKTIDISGIGIVDEYGKIDTKILQMKLPRKELRRTLPIDKNELEKETKLETIFEHMKQDLNVKDEGLLVVKQNLLKSLKF
jgi:hypothetical protein